MQSRTPVLFTVLALLALLCFYEPAIIQGKTFYYRDNTLFFEPLCRYLGERFANFQLPLWNNYSYCGMSELANPSPGIFYPFNWLFALMDYSGAVAILMIIHQIIVAFGTYMLIRSFGGAPLSAIIGGLAMCLNGWNFSLESNYSIVASASWIPTLLYGMRTLESDPSPKRGVCVALVAALMIYAGRPEMVAPGIVLALLFPMIILYRKWISKAKDYQNAESERVAFLQASSLLTGVLLAAPQIVPTLEWLQLSRRAQGLLPEEVLIFSANWYDLLGIIAPQPLGDLTMRGNQFLAIVGDGRMAPYIPSAFIGPVVASLACIELFSKKSKWRWYWASAFALTLLWCLGSTTAAGEIMLQILPALSFFRFPSKFLIFPLACIIALAAMGVHRLMKEGASAMPILAIWGFIGALGVCSICIPGMGVFSVFGNAELKNLLPDTFGQADLLMGKALLPVAALGLATSLLIWAKSSGKISERTFAVTLPLMLVVSLMMAAVKQQHMAAKDFYLQPSLVSKLLQAKPKSPVNGEHLRVLGLSIESFTCPPSRQTGDPQDNTVEWYQYARQLLNPNTNIDSRIESPNGYEASMCGDYVDAFIRCYDQSTQTRRQDSPNNDVPLHRFCQETATQFVTTQIYRFARRGHPPEQVKPLDTKLFELKYESATNNLRIYAVKNPMPRFRFAQNWISSNDRAGRYLGDSNQIIIEGVTDVHPSAAEVTSAEVSAEIQSPERICVSIKSPTQGLLLVADQFYPGWEATLDGNPAPILRANGFFKAVAMQKGSHRLLLEYRPKSLLIGLSTAVLALVYFALVWVWYRQLFEKALK